MNALLDTSILIDLARKFPPALAWFVNQQNSVFGVSTMAYMEMMTGDENKIAQRRTRVFLERFDLIYLEYDDQRWAVEQLALYRLSHNVGLLDCLIAAPAARLNLPLYAANLRHFAPLLNDLVQKPY